MSKIVFITGATSGFGKACALQFAEAGHDIIINGRREDRLQQLKKDIEERFSVRVLPLPFDVSRRQEVFEAVDTIPGKWRNINILINNAGLALGRDFFDEADIDEWDTMLDTNVKGLLYVSKAVLPFMIAQNKGHVINLGSVAAKEVYERGNVYCASKFAVEAISKSMRIDLLRHNIKVTAIHPGAAETEFSLVRFNGDAAKANAVYNGFKPLTAKDVADVIYYCTTVPEHVCINDLVICPVQQADAIYFHKK
ncbi:SDR family NAD(P)-dependent oxidoreductase [Agriterribacter sp.]|uniref:SDR family NAD(P)-dependent oxidoreductase n=1 Tax=Agriterribacter sp. TaxID=2821509 RepID=UPI002B76B8B6|nr:SDR family NAD(P)-dependent oxidoreductase [Agriterribacter sp.]HRO45516.1 SDR family NAD(P)-dependent oxidoreductase [Agriterribacter sp.]HRQ19462.1 SDR family NAD(P)-dependent oxidoreductase [Agriterribacter sp.]